MQFNLSYVEENWEEMPYKFNLRHITPPQLYLTPLKIMETFTRDTGNGVANAIIFTITSASIQNRMTVTLQLFKQVLDLIFYTIFIFISRVFMSLAIFSIIMKSAHLRWVS